MRAGLKVCLAFSSFGSVLTAIEFGLEFALDKWNEEVIQESPDFNASSSQL
jgi:hypothetical protein